MQLVIWADLVHRNPAVWVVSGSAQNSIPLYMLHRGSPTLIMHYGGDGPDTQNDLVH